MVCNFYKMAIRKTFGAVALLFFCNCLECLVRSFRPLFLGKPSYSHRGILDRTSHLTVIHDNTNEGEKEYFGESSMDEKNLNTVNQSEKGQESFASGYCYVDLDDISMPFVSREDSESTFLEYTDDGLCIPAGPVGQLKESIANFLTEPSFEIVIASVVLLNSLLVAISTVDSLSYLLPYIRDAETIIGTIFFADFVARWFSSSRDKLGFVLDPQFAIDILVVIIPLVASITPASIWIEVNFLPSALAERSGLVNLQLLRVLRLQRFLQDLDTFERFVEKVLGKTNVKTNIVQDWQLQLARVVLSLFTLLSVATGLIYTAENVVNPKINNYFDALYFGLTTLTTVGFGDVNPVTWQGRLTVCGSIIFGVTVIPAQTAALFEALLDRENSRKGRRNSSSAKTKTSRQSSKVLTKSGLSTAETDESVLVLDTETTCPFCDASFHWSCARYCYKCGETIERVE